MLTSAGWAQEASPLTRVAQVTCPGVLTDQGVNADQLLAMVRAGLPAATGTDSPTTAWGRFLRSGDVVGLKVDAPGDGALGTHRELVLAVAQTLQEAGVPADQILIFGETAVGMTAAGWTLCDEAGAIRVLACDQAGYDPEEFVVCDPPGADGNRVSHLSNLVTRRITRLVALPALRYTPGLGMSGALTSLTFGLFDNSARGTAEGGASFVPKAYADPALQERLTCVIADALRPAYAGDEGGESGRPEGSLLCAVGEVPADAVGLALLNAERTAQGLAALPTGADHPAYLAAVAQAGLGLADLQQIEWAKLSP